MARVIPSLIAGAEVTSGRIAPVLNPHNNETICAVSLADAEISGGAIAAARAAQAAWAAVPAVKRGEILLKACALIEERSEELSRIVAEEAGKSLKDARGETGGAVQCGRFFAGEGQRLFGRTMPSNTANKYAMTIRQPCGVALLITAANTPAPNFAWKVFPALICGNAVVLKPAEDTPISADWMARVLIEAGVPAGALNVVQGLGAEVGPELTQHADVDVISFTGSDRVGRGIAQAAGADLKKLSLELGGKNAFVVCDDADLDKAVRWAALSAFSNAGQRCAAGSRFVIFDAVYDTFVEKFVAATKAQKLGVGDDCDLGPVINQRQITAMIDAIGRAQSAGARVLTGGNRAVGTLASGNYLEPTIVEGAAVDGELSLTELFGPIAALYRVRDYAEAVRVTNASPYGLTACIHTRSIDRGWHFTQVAQTGVVVVNGGTYGSEPHMPFGGRKASGNGSREPGTEALDVYSDLKDIYLWIDPP
ncbi:aldehyde dehydrogenase family protein [Candidatus Viadribacter manganicus]|uniref:aldehyde dehydrogenase family protein n=1 Tax=Candidatus Viadribacter manganicus TaxID=1759059 RepID=UPI000AB080B2|nr:aldehyde dehydrogenase family protein [Candidatus Viadribacter manganicus]